MRPTNDTTTKEKHEPVSPININAKILKIVAQLIKQHIKIAKLSLFQKCMVDLSLKHNTFQNFDRIGENVHVFLNR